MTPEVTIERMGRGHALTVSMTWRIDPGEAPSIKGNPEYRDVFINQIATDAKTKLVTHLPDKLKALKT